MLHATVWQDVLPLYFKHDNLRSFIRQLNIYGFQRVPITWAYNHHFVAWLKGKHATMIQTHDKASMDSMSQHPSLGFRRVCFVCLC